MAANKASATKQIKIPEFKPLRFPVRIRGLFPLVMHAWSKKAVDMMLAKQLKQATQKREAKDPEAEYNAARYVDPEGRDCIPATAVKSALINAASFAEGITKVAVRGSAFIEGDLLPITYDERIRRQDMVRIAMGTSDIRFRPEYRGWACEFHVQVLPNILTIEQFMGLLSIAGRCVGIGEMRPQTMGGSFGTFEVENVS